LAQLPISPPSPAQIVSVRPVANSSAHGATVRDPGAQEDDNPFEAVLAQELGLVPDAKALQGLGLPVAAVATDSDLKPGEDAAQTTAVSDAPVSPAYHGVISGAIPFPPALAGERVLPPANTASAARATVAFDSRQNLLAKESAAANAEIQLTAASAAADFAVSGKFALAAVAEGRREFALDTSLLDQHKTSLPAAIPAGSPAPAQVAQAPAATLEARVGERGWDQGLGDKLIWMAKQNQQVAQLHLNPPELGPLEITLTLNHDHASAQFISGHAQVRDAIEAAMPRLREMLAESGITLGNASVSTDAFREQAQPQPQHEPRAYAARPGSVSADSEIGTRGMQALRLSRGLVDTFA